ncbi:MAG: flagellar biosynthesis protein FlhF [Helicobacteraceae bacterium]|jgi:flagellar biosynthesis protein FlhF|nr:flagellar biosynthesis protein FlhF [Helicobacteraceae bacterium]
MKLHTFTVENPADALRIAVERFGKEAMIHSTKEIRRKGLGHRGLYEIVVGVPERAQNGGEQSEQPEEDVILTLTKAAREISEIAKVADMPTRSAPPRKTAVVVTPQQETVKTELVRKQAELTDLQKEIVKLTDRVRLIQNMMWEKTVDLRSMPIPPEFAEIYRVSRQSGILNEHLDAIMRLTLENMPLDMRQNSVLVRRYFNTLLRQMIPIRHEARLTRPSKKVIMLVGPTGVGKTTTLAKLAARFAYRLNEKYKVGLMTLDTYRIGAVEQLMYYAKMMRVGIETVQDPIDFSAALSSLRHCDIILIDTAGSSQHDKEKIMRIGQFLEAEKQTTIDVTLVLSSNSKYDDLRDIYKNFNSLEVDSIVATKLDETNSLGTLFSFLYETKKPLTYFSIGQEVPDDLIDAKADYFITCMLDGFRSERELN